MTGRTHAIISWSILTLSGLLTLGLLLYDMNSVSTRKLYNGHQIERLTKTLAKEGKPFEFRFEGYDKPVLDYLDIADYLCLTKAEVEQLHYRIKSSEFRYIITADISRSDRDLDYKSITASGYSSKIYNKGGIVVEVRNANCYGVTESTIDQLKSDLDPDKEYKLYVLRGQYSHVFVGFWAVEVSSDE